MRAWIAWLPRTGLSKPAEPERQLRESLVGGLRSGARCSGMRPADVPRCRDWSRPLDLVEGVRKLAVLRANAIGDYLVSLPAIEALRAAYPAAELVLLGADWHAAFLAGRPGPVDRCVPVPPTAGVRDDRPPSPPVAVDRFFPRMRAERFDLGVQFHGGGWPPHTLVPPP